MYPRYTQTAFEHNLKVTHNFFGSYYRNCYNQVDAAPSLIPQNHNFDVIKLHYNSHITSEKSSKNLKFNSLNENQENEPCRGKENIK